MTRLDQLAKPKRRNGEHISAIIERERRQALELENMSKMSLSQSSPSAKDKRKSRSMSQLGGQRAHSRDGSRSRQERFKIASPLQKHLKSADTAKSMTLLPNGVDKKSPSTKSGWKLKFSLKVELGCLEINALGTWLLHRQSADSSVSVVINHTHSANWVEDSH